MHLSDELSPVRDSSLLRARGVVPDKLRLSLFFGAHDVPNRSLDTGQVSGPGRFVSETNETSSRAGSDTRIALLRERHKTCGIQSKILATLTRKKHKLFVTKSRMNAECNVNVTEKFNVIRSLI